MTIHTDCNETPVHIIRHGREWEGIRDSKNPKEQRWKNESVIGLLVPTELIPSVIQKADYIHGNSRPERLQASSLIWFNSPDWARPRTRRVQRRRGCSPGARVLLWISSKPAAETGRECMDMAGSTTGPYSGIVLINRRGERGAKCRMGG